MPSIVSNAVDLIQDVLTWILILIPISGGAMLAWHAWMKQLNDGDSSEVANAKQKNEKCYHCIHYCNVCIWNCSINS